MNASDYIGRVGGLAAALGIGAVVALGLGSGVAGADASTSPSDASSSADVTKSPSSGTQSGERSASDAAPRRRPGRVTSRRIESRTTSAKDEIGTPGTRSPAGRGDAGPQEASDVSPSPSTAPDLVVSVPQARPAAPDVKKSPTSPAVPAPLWTLAAFARREIERGFHKPHDSGSGTASAKEEPADVATTADPAPAAKAVAPTELTASPTIKSAAVASGMTDPQQLYTGRPSLVERIFVVGLRVLNFATKLLHLPFSLSGSSLSVPLFTDGIPPAFVTGGLKVSSAVVDGQKVWTLAPAEPTGDYVVALHGGSYVGQVNIFQWWTYADMARSTGATVVVPLYDLAPKGTAATVVPKTADFISSQIEHYGAEHVSVLGDSAGGGIALSAVQLMVQRGAAVPSRMVLLSPVLDVTVSNPAIGSIDDPLLDPKTSRANGMLFAGDLDPRDPLVSPLYGSLAGLPPTTIYSGSLDIRSPDALVLRDKAIAAGAPITFVLRQGQIHDWVIFPFLPDARAEWPGVYAGLFGGEDVSEVD